MAGGGGRASYRARLDAGDRRFGIGLDPDRPLPDHQVLELVQRGHHERVPERAWCPKTEPFCEWQLFVDEPDIPSQTVVGTATGTSGILTVNYPKNFCGVIQADAIVGPSPWLYQFGHRKMIKTGKSCNGPPPTTTTTTTPQHNHDPAAPHHDHDPATPHHDDDEAAHHTTTTVAHTTTTTKASSRSRRARNRRRWPPVRTGRTRRPRARPPNFRSPAPMSDR